MLYLIGLFLNSVSNKRSKVSVSVLVSLKLRLVLQGHSRDFSTTGNTEVIDSPSPSLFVLLANKHR